MIFKALATVAHISPREAGKHTFTQAVAILREEADRRDPHAGQTVISSPEDIRRLLSGL